MQTYENFLPEFLLGLGGGDLNIEFNHGTHITAPLLDAKMALPCLKDAVTVDFRQHVEDLNSLFVKSESLPNSLDYDSIQNRSALYMADDATLEAIDLEYNYLNPKIDRQLTNEDYNLLNYISYKMQQNIAFGKETAIGLLNAMGTELYFRPVSFLRSCINIHAGFQEQTIAGHRASVLNPKNQNNSHYVVYAGVLINGALHNNYLSCPLFFHPQLGVDALFQNLINSYLTMESKNNITLNTAFLYMLGNIISPFWDGNKRTMFTIVCNELFHANQVIKIEDREEREQFFDELNNVIFEAKKHVLKEIPFDLKTISASFDNLLSPLSMVSYQKGLHKVITDLINQGSKGQLYPLYKKVADIFLQKTVFL